MTITQRGVSSRASLGFHLATPDFVTEDLLRAYPLDIRLWIEQHGGSNASNYLATGARYLWVFSQVLMVHFHCC